MCFVSSLLFFFSFFPKVQCGCKINRILFSSVVDNSCVICADGSSIKCECTWNARWIGWTATSPSSCPTSCRPYGGHICNWYDHITKCNNIHIYFCLYTFIQCNPIYNNTSISLHLYPFDFSVYHLLLAVSRIYALVSFVSMISPLIQFNYLTIDKWHNRNPTSEQDYDTFWHITRMTGFCFR